MYANEAIDLLGCSYNGLRKWGSRGKIRRWKDDHGKWIYNDDDVWSMIGKRVSKESLTTIYCRVAGTTESDRKVMADLAVREPAAFKALVDQAQAALK